MERLVTSSSAPFLILRIDAPVKLLYTTQKLAATLQCYCNISRTLQMLIGVLSQKKRTVLKGGEGISASYGAMLDDRLGPERLSQVESLGNDPVWGAGLGAE
ncbi:hypothetical protein ALC60_07523 [Trachymyrmex zeteki]|uniref:Uncharacterized protein n=1 Tax=Mycetomoellerius zeteki TaxID=64791 RepID=A0A151X048_9HYME|nr:hypothetical protein ALC60_07523 [Trachymyrmex zeteki]